MKTKTNIQPLETAFTNEVSFRKPGTRNWESLQIPSNTESTEDHVAESIRNKVEQNNENLKNNLLQSLQMQHLIVLAGSGCSCYAGGPRMCDLWNAVIGKVSSDNAKQVAAAINYPLDTDNNIEVFLSQVEAFLSFKSDAGIKTFLENAQKNILDMCSDFLKTDKLASHETLLHRLSRRRTRDQRLRVFTTNYDLCFEQAAASIGCVAIDGFSFMAQRRYDPRYFDYDIIRRPRSGDDDGNYLEGVFLLYKLHGSVNWEKTINGIVEKIKPEPQKACLIYPASGKYQQSYNQPFIESIAQYLTAIREPNTCLLVMGFGFNDAHLSEPLLSAVRSNPHLRLITVARSLEKNINDGQNHYLKELAELSANGYDVWFINESFENFVNRIPDLKSLTPAERLAKAISGVMQQ
jgi:hypothetical protein